MYRFLLFRVQGAFFGLYCCQTTQNWFPFSARICCRILFGRVFIPWSLSGITESLCISLINVLLFFAAERLCLTYETLVLLDWWISNTAPFAFRFICLIVLSSVDAVGKGTAFSEFVTQSCCFLDLCISSFRMTCIWHDQSQPVRQQVYGTPFQVDHSVEVLLLTSIPHLAL